MASDNSYPERPDAWLEQEVARLEGDAAPLRARLRELEADLELIRTELRRRARGAQLATRQALRRELQTGEHPALVEVLAAADVPPTPFAQLRFMRDSATPVRLGYASSSTQSMTFTDGRAAEEVYDLAAAAALYQSGWEAGTPALRGVRVHQEGSRAERVVSIDELHVEGLAPG